MILFRLFVSNVLMNYRYLAKVLKEKVFKVFYTEGIFELGIAQVVR